MTGDLDTGAEAAAGVVSTEQSEAGKSHHPQLTLTCGLEVGVGGGHAHGAPQLLARAAHPRHVLLHPGDPGDAVHAWDEALHPRHEADAGVLAVEAQQEPVTLAMLEKSSTLF